MKLVLIASAFASLLTLISAAESGRLAIRNATPYDFRLVQQNAIQMDNWILPKIIAAGSRQTIEVQFSSATNCSRVALGYAIYELNNIGLTFAVNALHTGIPNSGNINVIFMNFSNLGTDALMELWYKEDVAGYLEFMMSGQLGDFGFHLTNYELM